VAGDSARPTDERRIRPLHVVFLFFLGLAWGSSFLFTEIGIRTIPPATLAAARITGAALVLGLIAVGRGARPPRELRFWLYFLLAGMNGNAVPFILIGWGQVRIDSSLAAILLATTPLFTLLLAHFFIHDDRLSGRKTVGVALGFVGVVLLVGAGALATIGAAVWGQLAIVGAALSFAVTYLWARHLRALPPTISSAAALASAALWAVPASLIVDRPWTLTPSAESLLAAAALALFSTAAANVVFFWLVSQTRASFVSLTNYIIPAVGVMWGVTLLGETITWQALIALAVIMAGLALSSTARERAAGRPS